MISSASQDNLLLSFLPPKTGGWEKELSLAKKNVVLLRRDAILSRKGISPTEQAYHETVEAEKKRIHDTLPIIQKLADLCEEAKIPYVFTKSFQHFPDMGHDIDLLVMDSSSRIDNLLREKLDIVPAGDSLTNKVAGKTSYRIPGLETSLEIHHGRVGHIGEYPAYARDLVHRKHKLQIDGHTFPVPSPEDQLIFSVLQRVYSHLNFRISDLLSGSALLHRQDMDWDYITRQIHALGIEPGFVFYKACVQESGESVLHFKRDCYRYQWYSVTSRLYGRKVLKAFSEGDWKNLGRILVFLPALSLLTSLRLIQRKFVGFLAI